MFLGNTLGSATSGLDSIERQIATLSQNVANASTPNYVREATPLSSVDYGAGGPGGVRAGASVRELDVQLQANLFALVGEEAGSAATQTTLNGIDQASGTPGSGQDLSSLVGALQDSFTTLSADPASTTQQLATVDTARSFVDGAHSLSDALVQARQKAQDALADDVKIANTALSAIGSLSNQIIAARASGQATAGLEDQRDGQMKSLAQLTGAKFRLQPNGDMQVIAANTILPTRAATGPFGLADVTFTPGTAATAVPALTMNGNIVSTLGGEMGAYLNLRDTTVPAMQSKLDGFAQSIASVFDGQGVRLLTDGAGTVPSAGQALGFAGTMQVSAAITATPSMLRDGTGPARASGDNTVIQNVLSNVFSPSGEGAPAQASALIAGFAQQASAASTTATSKTALRSGLENRLSAVSGVSVDSELAHMVQLQSAYAANAKVVTAVQTMWSQLLEIVR